MVAIAVSPDRRSRFRWSKAFATETYRELPRLELQSSALPILGVRVRHASVCESRRPGSSAAVAVEACLPSASLEHARAHALRWYRVSRAPPLLSVGPFSGFLNVWQGSK